MKTHTNAIRRVLAVAFFALAFFAMALPTLAYADTHEQTVKSGYHEVFENGDGKSYGWKLLVNVTITDGVVTDVVSSARGVTMVSLPEMEKPYYEPCHIIMEEYFVDAELLATDVDAIDGIDTVSGATHTSNTLKGAMKDALEKWNNARAEVAGTFLAALDEISQGNVSLDSVTAARDAYDALAEDQKGYVLPSEVQILLNAEQKVAVDAAVALIEAAKSGTDEAAVAAARAAYDALTDDQKALVPAETLKALTDAEQKLADDKAAAAEKNLANATVTVSGSAHVYNGKAQTPAVTVKSKGGVLLVNGSDYAVSYANNTNAGTAKVVVTGKGNYNGSKAATFAIAPASQTIKAAKTYKVKAKKAKKKAQKIAVKFTANGGGKVTYAAAKSGKVSIAKNGKVTVKKGTKKGTYTLKVKVTAAAVGNYAQTTSVVPLKIKVA